MTRLASNNTLENTLYVINSALLLWFFAFVIAGPKYSIATSTLLALSLLSLPLTIRTHPDLFRQLPPWLLGLGLYCLFHIGYRLLSHSEQLRIDPPARYLGAVLAYVHLARYGFSLHALHAGIALGCLIGGFAGIHDVLIQGAERAGVGLNPIAYGTTVALLAMACLHIATQYRNRLLIGLLGVSALIGLAGVSYSGTRGLYPAIAIGLLYLGYRLARRHRISRVRFISITAGMACLIGMLAYQVPVLENRIDQTRLEYAELLNGNFSSSAGQRLQMWHIGFYLFGEHPWLGLGPEVDDRLTASQAFVTRHGYDPAVLTNYDHLHNQYLNEAATTGIVGLAVLLYLLWSATQRLPTDQRSLIVGVVLILIIEGLTETVLNHQRIMMAFTLLTTALHAHSYWVRNLPSGNPINPRDRASPSASAVGQVR